MQKDQKTRARKESAKEKRKKKNRRSTNDFKLGTFVANFLFRTKRIEKTQILRSLQITAAMAEHRATGRRECACNGLQEEEKQEESSAASQRAIANQVVGTYHIVGDCSLTG
jgi:hypothetical protein